MEAAAQRMLPRGSPQGDVEESLRLPPDAKICNFPDYRNDLEVGRVPALGQGVGM